MRGRRQPAIGALLAAALSLGCPPKEPPQPPPGPGAGPDDAVLAPLPDPENAPTNRSAGDELVLTIPRIDGAGLDLRELRGKVVVIELSATWVDGWAERFRLYDHLLREQGGDRLAVILVAMDGERGALTPEPGLRGAGFDLAWDPQGALAAQLQAAAVPTVIILDPGGRITAVIASEVTPQAIADALSSALSAP